MNPELEQAILAQNIHGFDEVEAGHWVIRQRGSYDLPQPFKVDRVTKTQIIINDVRYHRDEGYEVGGSKYNSNRIQIPTPQLLVSIKVANAKRALRAMAEKITQEVGILTGNASVTEKTLEQVMAAHNQLQAALATLEGGK